MKIFWCFLISGYLGFNTTYAQSRFIIPVPILKESKRVDSLMDIVFNLKKLQKGNDGRFLTDSCWIVYMIKFKEYVSFSLAEKSNSVINGLVNKITYYKANLGYFEYKQNKIFVLTKDGFYDFFDKTSDREKLPFIYMLTVYKESPEEQMVTWHYKYKDGHFSIEEPPAIERTIK